MFWRDLRVFPPPALDVRSSFFAEQVRPSPETPGRRYLGICAHGERLKQVELRVFPFVMATAKAVSNLIEDWEAGVRDLHTTRYSSKQRRSR